MSDRSIARLSMAATTGFCWWLVHGYLADREVVGKYRIVISQAKQPRRFWAIVIVTALVSLIPFTLAVLSVWR